MGDWNERDHPRDPENGRFTDRPGSGGWARRISNAIGTGHGTPREKASAQLHKLYDDLGIHERDSITEYLDAVGEPSTPLSDHDLDYALAGHAAYAEDTDLNRLAGTVDRARFPTAAAHLDQEMQLRGGGSYFEPAAPGLADEQTAALRRIGFPPEPDDPAQARREDVMHALDPIGNYRRLLTNLHNDIGTPAALRDESVGSYLDVLSADDLPRPTDVSELDYGLSNMSQHIYDPADAQTMLDKLEAYRQRTGLYFPETVGVLEDIVDYVGE